METRDPREGTDQRNRCPSCRQRLDASTCITDKQARPKPGDYSICFNCGICLRFEKGGKLRTATEAELATEDKEVVQVLVRAKIALWRFRRERKLV